VFYASAFFVLAGGVAAPFEWVTPSGEDLLILGVVAIISMAGLLMLIKAYRLAQASILAPFDYTSMVWAVLIGWLIWNELPGPWIIAGTALVVFAGLIIVHREARMPHHALSLRGAIDE
jgi:drug/metabolite transporter (DMT)-like permease